MIKIAILKITPRVTMKGIPRRHHYVTRAYLELFLEPGDKHLYCYGRKRNEPFRNTPENLANIRDFYSFRRPDGGIDCSLETRIEREIETPGIPLIRKLASGKANLSHADRTKVAKLIALQSVRVPYERTFMDANNVSNLNSYLAEMDEASERFSAPVSALYLAVSLNGNPRSITKWTRITRAQVLAELKDADEDPTRSSRETFFSLASDIAAILVKMEWTVHRIYGADRFVTSDRPMLLKSSDEFGFGRGIRDLRSVVLFPLSSTALLEAKHHNWLLDAIRKRTRNTAKTGKRMRNLDITVRTAEPTFVELMNREHSRGAHLWLFSGRKEDWLVEWMQNPLKRPKKAVKVLDVEEEVNFGPGQGPHKIRKREFVIHEE
jgi:hypothetical protein